MKLSVAGGGVVVPAEVAGASLNTPVADPINIMTMNTRMNPRTIIKIIPLKKVVMGSVYVIVGAPTYVSVG